MKTDSEKYCHECGAVINAKAEICPKCGVRQPYSNLYSHSNQPTENRWLVTLLLCWILGVFGAHRFYTGHTGIAIAQLLTFGGCGIWTLVDLIIILLGNFKDAQGNPIRYA